MQIQSHTGGIFNTNCFYLPESGILIDAPQGAAEWLAARGAKVNTLLLTHGHIDHTWDAARIERTHGCRIGLHAETIPMVTEEGFFRSYGFGWEIELVRPESLDLLAETDEAEIGGVRFQILDVPGHCPGSLCFLERSQGILFGGDVLFAGGVGRYDLPGGDGELLFTGIVNKLLVLGDNVRVLPGHGPETTIGAERETNPYLLDFSRHLAGRD